VMGLRLGQRANGVSRLHGEVSREMFSGLWPGFDSEEIPIGSITNGVHAQTWLHPALLQMLETATGDGLDFDAVRSVDAGALWQCKRELRADLVAMVRSRLRASTQHRGLPTEWVDKVLDPDVLTFGFARRVPSYKRLTLMLRDPARLKALLTDPQRPIQIVIAGKSHPADEGGKRLIQEMVRFADDEEVRHRIVFLPDYDIAMARPLYPGCDVWLNNPLRPYEACGTSGMKAAMNGAANLSIRDGWWDEWYEPDFGWAIPSAEGVDDPDRRDDLEAAALYELIETEIAPRFYERDSDGLPLRWIAMMKATIAGLGPRVMATRMVRDYVTSLYGPASASSHELNDDPARTAEHVAWKQRVQQHWDRVSVGEVDSDLTGAVAVGDVVTVHATVHLGELAPDDVTVQLIAGRVNGDDELHDVVVEDAGAPESLGEGRYRYAGPIRVARAGALGYTARVVPRVRAGISVADLGLAVLPAEVEHPSA
ncbi:MAG TPA: alpha-glucan family phosphorylase, partial [Candidatus Avipropionibacterium avicola]|nr:alpha-glucan family phosphorylase [Candidatus Avipropionibacterium avicola]